ncbi:MAG: hypothetical protein JNL11_11850 [Bdellovibrionaceae bacterium]|nr:hypothetical protein [Pseudobdellovibrionaceae bacterium]
MNLEKLFDLIIGIVIAYAFSGHLKEVQMWVIKAQAKLVYESRTELWGSPKFFQHDKK